MALWQFTVIAALMGALLAYTGVLTNRIGRANAALRRIEDALLLKDGLTVPAATAIATAPTETTPPPEPTDMEDNAAPYLTIRDLKVRSEQRRALATASSESPNAPDMSGRFASLLFGRGKNEDPAAATSEGGDTPTANAAPPVEPPGLDAHPVETEDSVAASLESRDVLNTSEELTQAPVTRTMDEDSVEQREREALLFQSNQRRRRRARQRY
jgi:hypothetical protein